MSSTDAVSKATKILDAIDNHTANECPHCLELLNNIYKNGTGPHQDPAPTPSTNKPRTEFDYDTSDK